LKHSAIDADKPGAIIIEGHVQGLSNTRSLGEMGVPVYVVDKDNCIARYSHYCKKFFRSPDFSQDAFASFLIDLARSEGIKDWVLFPSNDHAVYTLSKHKQRLEEFYKVITPELNIIDNIYDKVKLIEIAQAHGIPVPITQVFRSMDDPMDKTLKFPVLTKGRNGLSFYKAIRKKALLARNERELRDQLRFIDDHYEISKSFTQEVIPFNGSNKTASFTGFCDKGVVKTHWTGIKLREHPISYGTATFTKNIYIEACHRQSERLLKALNYTGVCEVEYIQDTRDGEYKLIEINPRTWLWVELAKASAVDYAKIIYNYCQDQPVLYPQSDPLPRYWINPVTDTVFSVWAILKGKLNLLQYLASLLKREKINALFSRNDMKPGYAYIIHIFDYLKKR